MRDFQNLTKLALQKEKLEAMTFDRMISNYYHFQNPPVYIYSVKLIIDFIY